MLIHCDAQSINFTWEQNQQIVLGPFNVSKELGDASVRVNLVFDLR